MNPERRTLSRLALPLKVLADRFAFGALVILSLALLAVGKVNIHLLEGVSTRINDALVPALGALMQPVSASRRPTRSATCCTPPARTTHRPGP